MDQLAPPARPRLRRILRLSVRGTMIVVLVAAVGLGLFVRSAHQQRDAVAAIERTGGKVVYLWGRTPAGTLDLKAELRWPKWLITWLGPDYFADVVLVQLGIGATDAEMEHVGHLRHLEGISLPPGSPIGDAGVAHLRGLKALEHVGLSKSRATGAALVYLQGMARLKYLHLHDLKINDRDLANLVGLTSLRQLHLRNVSITDDGMDHLVDLVSLNVLDLEGSRVTGVGLTRLRNMTLLVRLNLSGTQVSSLASFPPLPRLQQLFLKGTPIDDQGLSWDPYLSELKNLDLGQTRVTGAGLAHLNILPKLTYLGLGSPRHDGSDLEHLDQFPSLISLELDESQLTDPNLSRLAKIPTLKQLRIRGGPASPAHLDAARRIIPGVRLTALPLSGKVATSRAEPEGRPTSP